MGFQNLQTKTNFNQLWRRYSILKICPHFAFTPCNSPIFFYSIAEYWSLVCFCSARTWFIYSVLNNALCVVTECLRPSSTDHLPVFSVIQPSELRQQEGVLFLARDSTLDMLCYFFKPVAYFVRFQKFAEHLDQVKS